MFKKNKFLPYGRHKLTKRDIFSVIKVLQSKNLTQGNCVPLFEKLLSNKVNATYAVAVNSATSALHITCLALDLKKNDWLWTSANTFVASANCGRYCDALVDFVDINPKTGLMCTVALEKKLKLAKKNGTLPKILVAVHFSGASCDMEKIFNLSKKYNFHIIEDASHALGGSYKNQKVGSCHYSIATVFSFHPVKIITTGEGGAVTTNNKELAKKISLLRSHGITKDKFQFESQIHDEWTYEQQALGFNYRMSDIHASLGISQLNKLEKIILDRNRKYDNYKMILQDLPVSLLEIPKNVRSSIHLAIIKLENKDPDFHRKIFSGLRKMNIGAQIHYSPVHLHPYYKNLGFCVGDFPEAEFHAKNSITIPLYVGLTTREQFRVAKSLKSLL
tara:strand:+ start:12012 stop:13181 length:1170 start_codon:yes stop_codon:yes gene_type:complete